MDLEQCWHNDIYSGRCQVHIKIRFLLFLFISFRSSVFLILWLRMYVCVCINLLFDLLFNHFLHYVFLSQKNIRQPPKCLHLYMYEKYIKGKKIFVSANSKWWQTSQCKCSIINRITCRYKIWYLLHRLFDAIEIWRCRVHNI